MVKTSFQPVSRGVGHEQVRLDLDGDPLVADVYRPAELNDALPVLLVHGWGGSGRYWQATIERLCQRYTLIVPDLPGVGRSMPARKTRDMFAQMQALEVLLAYVGVGRAHVVGHSMGAGITMLLAARRPDLVERLVLTSIVLFRTESERAFFNKLIDSADVFMRMRGVWMADLPLLAQQAARRFFVHVPDQPALLREAFRDYLLMDRATAVASARSATSAAIPEAARQIQAPTLLIVSQEDQLMPQANVAYTQHTIPRCEVRWIERCGHLPMVEKPDEYVSTLEGFLFNQEGHEEHEDCREKE
jgi:pimeloyl-ACP methyl ester carboxylesterase